MTGIPFLSVRSGDTQANAGASKKGKDLEVDDIVLCQQDTHVARQGHVTHAATAAAVNGLPQVRRGAVPAPISILQSLAIRGRLSQTPTSWK